MDKEKGGERERERGPPMYREKERKRKTNHPENAKSVWTWYVCVGHFASCYFGI